MAVAVVSQPPPAGEKLIGTHDGAFHCDEALACALLRRTDEFASATVLRTRNPELLKQCNIVVDVGAVYDDATLRFDHHQPEFQGTMTTPLKQYHTRLSSAGLVYKHYGMRVLRTLLADLTEQELDTVYDSVYKGFVEHIDGIDNGVAEYVSPSGEELTRNYQVTTSLSSRVGALHPRWNQPSTPEVYNEGFAKAMRMVEAEFLDKVDYVARAWLPARSFARRALASRNEVHESGQIIRLEQFCPYMDHLYELEREMGCEGQVLYCLFADVKQGWRVRAIGVEGQNFANRKSLPWKGLRDEELSAAAGIPGCVFVHASGFIGGHADADGALKMAVKALAA